MLHQKLLIALLAALATIGFTTIQLSFSPDSVQTARIVWLLVLVIIPLTLGGAMWIGWTWVAMACVVYGTIGLALDLATITSILAGRGGPDRLLLWSGISGSVNFLLIVFGGRAFWSSLQGSSIPGSRPPSPPSPSSSSVA